MAWMEGMSSLEGRGGLVEMAVSDLLGLLVEPGHLSGIAEWGGIESAPEAPRGNLRWDLKKMLIMQTMCRTLNR